MTIVDCTYKCPLASGKKIEMRLRSSERFIVVTLKMRENARCTER